MSKNVIKKIKRQVRNEITGNYLNDKFTGNANEK